MHRAFRLSNALVAAVVLVAAAGPAAAQSAVRVRGTIVSAQGADLIVKSREGAVVAVVLDAGTTVSRRVQADAGAIHPQDYVGVTALPFRGDELKAVEVFVFPPSMRGQGEGHRPFDLMPESTMTNATIAETLESVDGKAMRLTYKGGERSIVLTPETRYFTYAEGSREDLKPGRQVSFSAKKAGDGMSTSRISVDEP